MKESIHPLLSRSLPERMRLSAVLFPVKTHTQEARTACIRQFIVTSQGAI